jgi:hypothetical protein
MQLNFYLIFNNMFICKSVSNRISKKNTFAMLDTHKTSVSVSREQAQHNLRNLKNR